MLQRVLLMDEISTGLDSATTYTVTEYLRTTTHYLNLTTLVSLLQPPPEVLHPLQHIPPPLHGLTARAHMQCNAPHGHWAKLTLSLLFCRCTSSLMTCCS